MATRLESYSNTPPRMVSQGIALRGHVKKHGEWIADGNPDSETLRRYRTLPHAIKNVGYLAGLEPDAYHPYIVRDEAGKVAGTATIYAGTGVQHPKMPRPTTGADIDYLLTEKASDEEHLSTVRSLLEATGSVALRDAINVARSEDVRGENAAGWSEAYRPEREVSAFAVVPTRYADNRLKGFELAHEAGYMERVEGPASLTVPDEYAHELIDLAKGGQQVQLYYAAELPARQS